MPRPARAPPRAARDTARERPDDVATATPAGERLNVGVIAGYQAQTDRLRRTIRPGDASWTHLAIDVHPVDSFQAQERHVIIYSVVRSNPEGT
jgi:superfamily I DNA and/or RNA helicase